MRRLLPLLLAAPLLASVTSCGSASTSGTTTTSSTTPPPATAIHGVVHVEGPKLRLPVGDYDIDVDANGSYRVAGKATTPGYAEAFDSQHLLMTTFDGASSSMLVTTGAAPARPDSRTTPSLWFDGLSSEVVRRADLHDPSIRATQFLGRTAWQLETSIDGDRLGESPDHAVAIVDQQTLQPVSEVLSRKGQPYSSVAYTELDTTADQSTTSYDVRDLGGPTAKVTTVDDGFRASRLEDVAATVGYAPVVPAHLPVGATPSMVAVHPGPGKSSGAEGMGPVSTDVVVIDYRSGWRHLAISTRKTGGADQHWEDPFATEGIVVSRSAITLTGGALAGAVGQSAASPTTLPHLWAKAPNLVLTVAGPATVEELAATANSLHQ